jgi:hypothetical protein
MAQYAFTFTSGDTVTPTKINDARTVSEIVDADIKSDAAIAGSKLADGAITDAKVDASAAIAGTKIDPLVAAGTYTPTVTADTNVTSVGSVRIFQWMRVGSVVTVSGSANLTPTTAGSAARIFISLPIASTFTEFAQLTGVSSVNTSTSSRGYGAVLADMATGTRASVNFYPEHTAGRDYNFHWTYQII